MCGSMVDIQSPTAEIRRGRKIEERKIETTGQKYNVRICYAGRPQQYGVEVWQKEYKLLQVF